MMGIKEELGADLVAALERFAEEKARLSRSLQGLTKILGGIGGGVYAMVLTFGDPEHPGEHSFTSLLTDGQLITLVAVALLAIYFLAKRRHRRRLSRELDDIWRRLGHQAPDAWKIWSAADQIYDELCRTQRIAKESL